MNKNIFFSIVLVVLAILIALTIIFIRKEVDIKPEEKKVEEKNLEIRPVSNEDHILGDPDADILIIEYSDFECEYCQEFQVTMNRIIEEYGKNSRVAWVYRHFPIEKAHKQSRGASIASECVADILGKERFFEYTNRVFAGVPDSLSAENLKNIAKEMKVEEDKYDTCIKSGKFDAKIDRDIEDGKNIYKLDPNFGTPYNIIIAKNGFKTTMMGSQPYIILKEIIELNSL